MHDEEGLETVLEVPMPEDMFTNIDNTNNDNNVGSKWQNMRNVVRARHVDQAYLQQATSPGANDQFMLLLKLIGYALIPFQVRSDQARKVQINGKSIEASTATYIVQQYLAATGGQAALNSISSMYAIGQLSMVITSDMRHNDDSVNGRQNCQVGGFVLWQKNPDLWNLELVFSGCKIGAGSDGKVAWNQSSSNSTASKGPPRPLRRFFQGLDPRSTANLFLNATSTGETTIKDEDCFILKLETNKEILKAQNTAHTEMVYHTICGYFSQRTGLLIQFEDTKLVRMRNAKGDDNVFWETSMISVLDDYRYVEGINIAHSGKTEASIYRYGKKMNTRWKIVEDWKIEEVDFNICGLCMDCFLPPSDVKHEQEHEQEE